MQVTYKKIFTVVVQTTNIYHVKTFTAAIFDHCCASTYDPLQSALKPIDSAMVAREGGRKTRKDIKRIHFIL